MKTTLQVRVALCVLLVLGALASVACSGTGDKAGGGSAGSGSGDLGSAVAVALAGCPHATPTTVPIALVVIAPNVIIASPPAAGLCPGDTAVWTLENKCSSCGKVKEKIEKRTRRNSSTCAFATTAVPNDDCFKPKNGADCKPEKADVEYNTGPQPLGDCEIKSGAYNGCYKYDLKGTYDIDPEVEVQGGVGITPKGMPSPSVSPSP